jgi:hypothetical protein
MTSTSQKDVKLLVEKLAHALAGTSGRDMSVDAIRTLAAMEVTEWKNEVYPQPPSRQKSAPLIAGPIQLMC